MVHKKKHNNAVNVYKLNKLSEAFAYMDVEAVKTKKKNKNAISNTKVAQLNTSGF